MRKYFVFVLGFGCVIMLFAYVWVALAHPKFPRDREIMPISEEQKKLQVVAFGTSLTQSSSWPRHLEIALSKCLGLPVQVRRIARNGAGSTWALQVVEQVVQAAPDLVLMEFAINDADLYDGVSLWRSRAQHGALIEQIQETVPPGRIVLMTMNPVGGLHHGLRFFLPRYYAQQVSLSDEYGTALADLYADWLELPAPDRDFRDGLHPSPVHTSRVVVPGLTHRIARAAGVECP